MSAKFSSTPSSLWDQVSSTYEEHSYKEKDGLYPANSFRYEIILDFLENKPKGKILDAGCGPGLMSRILLRKGWDVVSVDYSQGMIETAKNKAAEEDLEGNFQKMDLTELSKLNQKFDYVILNGVLPYVEEELEPKVFEELRKVCSKNAVLIASHYNVYFDIFGMDQWGVDAFIEHILKPTGIAEGDLIFARKKIESLLNEPEKVLDKDKTMRLEDPLSYKEKLNKFGFQEFDQAYYNLFYLPAKFESEQKQETRKILEKKLRRDPKALLLARGFVSFAKFIG